MPKATIFARTDRAKKSEVPLYLRLIHKGDRARMSLDLTVKSRQWHADKKRVRSSHPQSEYLNQYLSDVQAAANGAIAKLKSRGVVPAPERVKEEVQDVRDVSTEAKEFKERQRANALANKYLRQIADQLDISHLSFHMARNLSVWQYYQNTDDIYQVTQMMGHASVDQTRDYLRGFGADLDDSFRDAFS